MLLNLLPRRNLSIVLLGAVCAIAPACLSAGEDFGRQLGIKSQADADAAAGTTALDGLYITGDVTDLSPLSSLTTVRQQILVDGTSALQSLHGLENIRAEEIDGLHLSVRLHDNAALTDISALQMPRASIIELIGGNAALADIDLYMIELDYLVVKNEPTAAAVRSSTLEVINQSIQVEEVPQLCTVDLPALRLLGGIGAHYEVCWPEEDREALEEQAGNG